MLRASSTSSLKILQILAKKIYFYYFIYPIPNAPYISISKYFPTSFKYCFYWFGEKVIMS